MDFLNYDKNLFLANYRFFFNFWRVLILANLTQFTKFVKIELFQNVYPPSWRYQSFDQLTPLDFESNLPWLSWNFEKLSLFFIDPLENHVFASTFGIPPWNFHWYPQQGVTVFFLENPIGSLKLCYIPNLGLFNKRVFILFKLVLYV